MIPDFPLGNLLLYLTLLVACFSWCGHTQDYTAGGLFFVTSLVGALAIERLTVRSEAIYHQMEQLRKKAHGRE